jgi:cytidine deaminase
VLAPAHPSPWFDKLNRLAIRAARRAYCPYSKFHVGVALVSDRGRFFAGCNVENASYGLTVCAERAALFSMVAAGHRAFKEMVVVCPDLPADAELACRMPCGACRQVMAELSVHNSRVIVPGHREFWLVDLLPEPFRL